jgi:hypothetical protein
MQPAAQLASARYRRSLPSPRTGRCGDPFSETSCEAQRAAPARLSDPPPRAARRWIADPTTPRTLSGGRTSGVRVDDVRLSLRDRSRPPFAARRPVPIRRLRRGRAIAQSALRLQRVVTVVPAGDSDVHQRGMRRAIGADARLALTPGSPTARPRSRRSASCSPTSRCWTCRCRPSAASRSAVASRPTRRCGNPASCVKRVSRRRGRRARAPDGPSA